MSTDTDVRPTKKGRGGRVAMFGLGLLLVLVLLCAGGLFAVTQHLGNQVGRYPRVFAELDPSTRPADSPSQTYLLVGTDSRSPDPTTGRDAPAPDFVFGAQRSDVIMLATVADTGRSGSVVSIPRDSWVDIPGRGMNKINAAYSFGGPDLLIATVEQLTRIRVDHFAVIDFAGFAEMTDAVGGLDIDVGIPSSRDDVVVPAGPQRLDGRQALVYVRERYGLPAGDLDRVRRHQNALRAFVERASTSGALTSPTAAYGLADTVSHFVGVDDSLSNLDLATTAYGLRNLRLPDVEFLTVPVLGTGTEGEASVIYLDRAAGNDLWFAVNTESTALWTATRPGARLAPTPR